MPSVQIKNVPTIVLDELKAAAVVRGQSLQAYLLALLVEHTDDIAVNKRLFAEISREAAEARDNGTARGPRDSAYYADLVRQDRDR